MHFDYQNKYFSIELKTLLKRGFEIIPSEIKSAYFEDSGLVLQNFGELQICVDPFLQGFLSVSVSQILSPSKLSANYFLHLYTITPT